MRQRAILLCTVAAIIAVGAVSFLALSQAPAEQEISEPVFYTFDVVNVYPHDPDAFTQGLVYDDGYLYEGTGLWGKSSLRRVCLETGEVLQNHSLSERFFGEGITVFGDRIVQLTWRSGVGFIYDKHSFALLQSFNYSGEGWGLTNNGSVLIMSDGSSTLRFLDPYSFQNVGQVNVTSAGEPVTMLNELEYIDGQVYANVWLTDRIAVINPETGQVTAWIELEGLNPEESDNTSSVLNGIAYDPERCRLFVTGKLWSKLYEIKLVPTG